MQVIGLSGCAGAGKTEAAKIIASCYPTGDCVIVPFAEQLKDVCMREFGWDGKKDGRGRRLLQVVGTEAGREYNPRIWVDKWIASVNTYKSSKIRCVIADDVRFANESGAVRSFGGVVWQINRPNMICTGEVPHVSELPLQPHLVDAVIENRGNIVRLHVKVLARLEEMLKKGGA